MREKALDVARHYDTEQDKLNHLREYLQHMMLRELFELSWMSDLVFHGGTALRILYDLNRFSEDLDFHLKTPREDYSLDTRTNSLRKKLELNGYRIEITRSTEGNVVNAVIKFAGALLYEAGISPHENQKLRIKIEIDTNPPNGFGTTNSLVNEYFPFAVNHHDPPTFIAGKVHAIIQREWAKGRDFYDLLFYLTKWGDVEPNFTYLNNALIQTGYRGSMITHDNWKERLSERIDKLSWDNVKEDVEPFLLNKKDAEVFSKEFLIDELSRDRNGDGA